MSSSSSSEIIKKRFFGFLIWQSIHSTLIYFLSKTLLSVFRPHFFTFSLLTPLSFLTFHLSLLLFSYSLSFISSPQPNPSSPPTELTLSLVRFLFNSLIGSSSLNLSTPAFRNRVKTSLGFIIFVISSALSGSLAIVSLCRNSDVFDGLKLAGLGFRGFVFGLIYGIHYIYFQRWVLAFPIIQRPPFFSFKMGLPSAMTIAIKLSSLGFFCSAVILVFLPDQFKSQGTVWKFIAEQIIFYVGSVSVSLCWEVAHHLHQVLHTKRCTLAPPKGSAAAETNPTEPLLAALEESPPKSLLQYLAYLDLCTICESNVDSWRRAAFFEESGETYRRVISVCLRPLEQMTSTLTQGLEGDSVDQISHQLLSPSDTVNEFKLHQSFNDFQLCVWCARTVSSLTTRSHKDDRYGVAQLSGCNASVISTLLSCLLAVEACMGKKTHLQASQLMGGPTTIKWAIPNRRDGGAVTGTGFVGKRRGGPLHGKAYAMADVLRTSIYMIVSVFQGEMMGSTKAGNLERDWIVGGKPLYGTKEILVQKLGFFLEFRAS